MHHSTCFCCGNISYNLKTRSTVICSLISFIGVFFPTSLLNMESKCEFSKVNINGYHCPKLQSSMTEIPKGKFPNTQNSLNRNDIGLGVA